MTSRSARELRRAFFERPVLRVAIDLLGRELVSTRGGSLRRARIVEVEAYAGDGLDPASHSHPGPTRRNASMFGPAGRFYVYRSMGMHVCLNVVCEVRGRGAAVLLRAARPLAGVEAMRHARGGRPDAELLNGPGKLAQAFGVVLEDDGRPVLRGPLRIEAGAPVAHAAVRAGPRIGISKATELAYRFFVADDPHVSRAAQNRHARSLSGGAA